MTKKETFTISKTTFWKLTSGFLAILLLISVFTGGFGTGNSKDTVQPAAAKPAANTGNSGPELNMVDLIDDDTIKGDKNAPVTIVEWSDFECPFCARFYEQTLPQIEKNYIDTGKVKLVFRDFPLNFHANAQKAAEAAECAGEQDKYWEMHDMLFEKAVQGGVSSFKQYADDIGLNTNKFNSCLDSGEMAAEVAADMRAGQAAGITGTPGFIINGKIVSGAQPYQAFAAAIEEALQ